MKSLRKGLQLGRLCLECKHYTKLERFARDEHFSLLRILVNTPIKSFITLGQGLNKWWTLEKLDNKVIFLVQRVSGSGPEQRESEKTVLYL
jgi:hypothetical protein